MNLAATYKLPKLSLSQIINMSIGFFGIQFGWDLQRANMGVIYHNLGAEVDNIPYLFLAAPITGLLVQPIIGYLSDRTWHPVFGRRRPYFFIGALISSIALILMPYSSALWMAAGLLWVLDVFGNVAMEPFRAFVIDKLPPEQVNQGFIMQSLFIGLGGCIASALPYIFTNIFDINNTASTGRIADNVLYAFITGAFFFFFGVLYTILTTKEYPPADIPLKEKGLATKKGFGSGFREILDTIRNMPQKMKWVALVQFFTWPGLFLMWFYYALAVAKNIFKGDDRGSIEAQKLFGEGKDFAGLTLSFYNVVTLVFAFILPLLANKLGRKLTHTICLAIGGLGLISIGFIHEKNNLFLAMTCIGIAWASILSMPYAMLSDTLPAGKIGIYMGIFNFFIVLPEIIASFCYPYLMSTILNNNMVLAVQSGGLLMLLAGLFCVIGIKGKG